MSFMRAPAFQFYPSNYLGSRAVRLMDAEQRGWYTQLLFESWESEPQATLPNDDALLRVLAGVNTCSADVEQRWAFVKAQFKHKGKLLYNSRLLEEFAKQDEFREKRREAGRASGEARRAQREAVKAQHLSGSAGKRSKANTCSTDVPLCSDSVRTKDEHNRTLNTPISVSVLEEKKDPANAEFMKFLSHKIGAIPNPAKEGKAIRWLIENGYDIAQCRECYEHLAGESWRTATVTWTTVKAEIGGWLSKGKQNGTNRPRNESASERNARNLRENAAYIRNIPNSDSEADREDPIGFLASGF